MSDIQLNNETLIANKKVEQLIKLISLIVFILGFIYLILMNHLATKGFGLEQLKADKLVWQKEIEAIDIDLAIPTSIYALESNQIVQEMPLIKSKTFLESSNDKVAFFGE